MFRIYKRTIHFGTTDDVQRLGYKVQHDAGSGIYNILAIPAVIAGAVLGSVVFSVFFVVLLIPLGVVGFRAWRLMKAAQQQGVPRSTDDSLTAEYTIISDKNKS